MSEATLRAWVNSALDSLNDNLRLANCALATADPELAAIVPLDERAEAVRSLLLQAIETLRPPRRFGFGSLETRHYDVLTLRYVENLTVRQMMAELHLSRRQIYRALAQAEARLAGVLTIDGDLGRAEDAGAAEPAFAGQPVQMDLGEVIDASASLVRPLAAGLGVTVTVEERPDGVVVVGDRALVKQTLVQLLSAAVQAAPGGEVTLRVQECADHALTTLAFRATAPVQLARLADTRSVAAAHGITCRLDLERPPASAIQLKLPRGRPRSVLVIEDSAGAVDLYRRYLSGAGWAVHSVADARAALDVARRVQADAIVLDIMMPHVDGWSVLQLLRAHEETAATPVLVCSVVEDPELALALGASAYLRKPVTHEQFVTALRRLVR